MIAALLLSTQLLAADAGPPGVPWPPPAPPVYAHAARPTLHLDSYRRRTTLARLGLGMSISGPILFGVGAANLNRNWGSGGPILLMLGGFFLTAGGPPLLLAGAQGSYNQLNGAGLDVSGAPVAAGWISLAFIPVMGLGIPLSVIGGVLQLRENERALKRLEVSMVPQLLPGEDALLPRGAGLSLVVRL